MSDEEAAGYERLKLFSCAEAELRAYGLEAQLIGPDVISFH